MRQDENNFREALEKYGDNPITMTGKEFVNYLDMACAQGKKEGKLLLLKDIDTEVAKISRTDCEKCSAYRRVIKNYMEDLLK